MSLRRVATAALPLQAADAGAPRVAAGKLRGSFCGNRDEFVTCPQRVLARKQRLGRGQEEVTRGVPVVKAVVAAPPAPSFAQDSKIELWEGAKRLQTQVFPLAPDTMAIRSLDWDRDRFDIEFGLQNGTTYNSYVIRGSKGIALVDASHKKFTSLYLDALRGVMEGLVGGGAADPLSAIDFIVANHTEPDHSGLIPNLVKIAPKATVVASKVATQFLQNLMNEPFNSRVVKGGETLDLGDGHELEFVMAPNLHWPDTMFTLDKGTGVMYTCDAFGAHYCSLDPFDSDLSELDPHFRFYYDCLMRPNSRSVLTALRKTSSWEYSTIATGHGQILRYNIADWIGKYEKWSKAALEKQKAGVLVLYVSDYGFSDRLSQSIARGLTKTSAGVEMADLNTVDTQELVEMVQRSAAVVVMTPPTANSQANRAFSTLFSALNPKQAVLVAESYGGDDEPVDTLIAQFTAQGLKAPLPPLRVKDVPTEALYQEFEEAGTDLGQLLTKKEMMAERKSSMSVDVAKALARVSGGLYIVTASKGGVEGVGSSRGAMVASWVAQASFEPLGITICVAKDRAIESLMQVGDSFVVNCLEEGNYAGLMKHFLKRFPPGADRFDGIDLTSASNGSPILNDALAYMECMVVRRMETNDHWIVYAEVKDGNVKKTEGKTAAHHRKLADYY